MRQPMKKHVREILLVISWLKALHVH
jgi:hypothetical protein